ncbi:MAG: PspC domain-containing protein [Acidobacteriota bacterium]|nr:PspC domain-containing protein [Acidobacteriota bacterium]
MALSRSRSERMLGGVCGGLAKALGWSATRVRVVYVLLSVLSVAFPGIAVYIVLWILMPEEPSQEFATTRP